MRAIASPFFSLILVLATTRGVRAQDVAREAERLTQEGMALARTNRFDDAILRFRASERLVPRGANDCNIGLAYSMMERHPQALLYLDSCTHREGKDLRPWVPELRAKTRRALERGKYAEINLVTEPVAARVTVAAWGPESSFTAPRLFWLPLGDHTLRVQATGHLDSERKVAIATTSPQRVQIELAATPEPPKPATPSPPITPLPITTTPSTVSQPAISTPHSQTPVASRILSPRKRAIRFAGYSLLGFGVASGGAIVGSGYALLYQGVDRNDRDRYDTGRALFTAGWAVGGVTLATGAILTIVGHLE